MSDTSPTAAPAPAPAAPVPAAPAPAPAPATPAAPAPVAPVAAPAAPAMISADQVQAMINAAVAQAVATVAPAAPAAPPEKAPLAQNAFTKGAIVVHNWWDYYSGTMATRYGLVVDLVPAVLNEDGSIARGASSVLAWLDGPSGAIGDQDLAAV